MSNNLYHNDFVTSPSPVFSPLFLNGNINGNGNLNGSIQSSNPYLYPFSPLSSSTSPGSSVDYTEPMLVRGRYSNSPVDLEDKDFSNRTINRTSSNGKIVYDNNSSLRSQSPGNKFSISPVCKLYFFSILFYSIFYIASDNQVFQKL
jgi:hypothetical protein